MRRNLVWLLDVVTETKETLVSEDGIGADLPPMVAAFDEDGLPIGQAQVRTSSESREDQFRRLIAVATLMRSGWHASSLGIVLEGYMVVGGDRTDTTSLASRFADGDRSVVECISIVYADIDGSKTVISLPYSVGLGRKVEWLHDQQQIAHGEETTGLYPQILGEIFERVELVRFSQATPQEVAIMAIATEIIDRGFRVVCQSIDESAQRWLDES